MSTTKGETINIYARLRKVMQWETKTLSTTVKGDKTVINRTGENKKTKYEFTKAFDPSIENKPIFDQICKPMLNKVLKGFNGILIAYGQTGSGKTHSILGNDCSDGILPQSLDYLLNEKKVSKLQISAIETFGVHVAKTQLYDLCSDKNSSLNWNEKEGNTKLDPKKSQRIVIKDSKHSRKILKNLYKSSHVAPTGKNPVSSRGHVAYIIRVSLNGNSDNNDNDSNERRLTSDTSELNKGAYWVVVDLAGSEGESALTEEFIKKYKEDEINSRRYEAWCINHGLSQLQMIFNELRKKGKLSKLVGTGLRKSLHPFINKQSNISILFTISPSKDNNRATESTLRFAEMAGHVRTSPVKATIKINKDSLIKELQDYILYQKDIINKLNNKIENLEINLLNKNEEIKVIKEENNTIPIELQNKLKEYEKLKEEEKLWNVRESNINKNIDLNDINNKINEQMDDKHSKLRIVDNNDNDNDNVSIDDIGLDIQETEMEEEPQPQQEQEQDINENEKEVESDTESTAEKEIPTKSGDKTEQCKCVIL